MSDINQFNEINALVSCTARQCLYYILNMAKKKVHSESKHAGPEKVNYQMLYIFSSLINIIYTYTLQFSSWPFNCNVICTAQ